MDADQFREALLSEFRDMRRNGLHFADRMRPVEEEMLKTLVHIANTLERISNRVDIILEKKGR
jgi:hypothetical protein